MYSSLPPGETRTNIIWLTFTFEDADSGPISSTSLKLRWSAKPHIVTVFDLLSHPSAYSVPLPDGTHASRPRKHSSLTKRLVPVRPITLLTIDVAVAHTHTSTAPGPVDIPCAARRARPQRRHAFGGFQMTSVGARPNVFHSAAHTLDNADSSRVAHA